MIRKILPFVFLFVLTVGMAVPAFAWNSFGHMEVAYVAYQSLTPAARARANALLKLNPNYDKWVSWLPAGTSDTDKDMMIFMLAATWPDEIRGDHSYISDGRPGANPTANGGYGDKMVHQAWHFVDTPFSTDNTPLPPLPTPNAEDRITLFRQVLASSSPDALKSYDLTWILHMVGDVHQPLHAATRVSATDPQGDRGGNNVKLDCAKCELHAFWDGALGSVAMEKPDMSPVIATGKALAPADATKAADSDPKDWVAESFQAAKETVYAPPIGPGDGPFTLDDGYKTKAKQVVMERVALAGARLAHIINTELK